MTNIRSQARALLVSLGISLGLSLLMLALVALRSTLGTGLSITGAVRGGAVFQSDLLSVGSPLSWQHIFFHNLSSLALFALPPAVSALAVAGLRRPTMQASTNGMLAVIGLRREEPREREAGRDGRTLYSRCLLVAAVLLCVTAIVLGEELASLAAGWQMHPLVLMWPLASHHGIVEFMGLSLPSAALLYCRGATRRRMLPALLMAVLALSVGFLFVAAHIEASASPQAAYQAMMSSELSTLGNR